jgi:glutamate carboxypeptidase
MSRLYDLRDFCEAERDWIVREIELLAAIESPTLDKEAVDRCGRELAARLERIGGRVTRLPRRDAGDHLLAEFGCGASQILLLGHFDTVWPVGQLDRMPIVHASGRLHGPGVFDMKAGIALAMLATRALVETGAPLSRRVVMLWTSDEETGSRTSRSAVEEEARRSEAVLVLEPALAGGAVKTARKGCGDFDLEVTGVAAHAGLDPGSGASAILELARQILAVQALQDPARGVTINVGVVSGGSRPNVVADRAHARIDVRVPTATDAVRLEALIGALTPADPRTRIAVTGGFGRPPLERTPAVERLYGQAREIASLLGMSLGEGMAGGGSDGNFTAALGVPTLDGLGAIGDGAHAAHEHVELGSLPGRAALVAGLVARLGGADLA